jgi:hypothetical protein
VDLKALPTSRSSAYLALAMAAVVAAVCVRQGGFSAWGPDTCGYVSAGELWRHGDLHRPQPLPLWASWPNAAAVASPLTFRPGLVTGTEVSTYPLGFPVLIAAASFTGSFGAYIVTPAMAALLVWCAFTLARRLSGDLAGVIAAALTASSPVVLINTVHPMSDVPAAALWTAAWAMSLRTSVASGLASGLLAGVAVTIRPNLAPLFVVIAVVQWGHWKSLVVSSAAAAVGPLLVMWSQMVLYGGPLAPSYPDWAGFFKAAHIEVNLGLYPRLLARTHTWLPLIGLALPVVALVRRTALTSEARVIALTAGLMILINVAVYLPYIPYDDWPFLRFLLPGLTALFILFAGVLAYATRFVWREMRWAAVVVPVTAVIVAWQGLPMTRYALHDWYAQTRVRAMGKYLDATLPPNAAVLSFFHSCAVAHYTGRQVVRADLLIPAALDDVVDDLVDHGYKPVFVIDREVEEPQFRAMFAGSRYGRLDWPARAAFVAAGSVFYFDAGDLTRHQEGARWPVDVLRW